MKKGMALLPLIGLSVVGIASLGAWAGAATEEAVTLDQVPAAVKATILAEAAGAKITEIERETVDGKTTYEAEFIMANGDEVEIEVAPDGTLLGRKVEQDGDDDDDITIAQCPELARAALLKLAGQEKITRVEREKEHDVLIYEAEWVVAGVEHEATVTEDGTLLETEMVIPADKAPAAVRASIVRHFGANTKVVVERKTIIVYEVEAKIDGKKKELLIFPTGKVHSEPGQNDDDDHSNGPDGNAGHDRHDGHDGD